MEATAYCWTASSDGETMTKIFFTKAKQRPSLFASLGLVVVILAAAVLLLAGPILGYIQQTSNLPEQIFEWRLKIFSLVGLFLLGGSSLTLIGILHGRLSSRVRTSWRGFVAVLLAACVALPLWLIDKANRTAPALHDITTNIADPPYFRQLRERSYSTESAVDLLGGRLDPNYASLHHSAFPDLKPLRIAAPPGEVLKLVEVLVERQGWTLADTRLADGYIEASAINPWLQLRTDIAVRVRPNDAGASSLVDIRAVSELGVGDFGISAQLVLGLRDTLQNEFSQE